MITIVDFWMKVPFSLRVLVTVMVVIGIWSVLGKAVLVVLSIIPLMLRKIWSTMYLIVEFPIVFLHEKFGRVFYEIDNFMAEFGSRIDNLLKKWWRYFRTGYRFEAKKTFLIGAVVWLYIIVSYQLPNDLKIISFGKDLYCSAEDSIINAMLSNYPEDAQVVNLFGWNDTTTDMKLTVYGVSSTLYVRDIPNKDDGVALANLYNGDEVQWTGKMRFAEWDYGQRVILVEIVTVNGIQGWSLLDYLYFDEYDNVIFKVDVEKLEENKSVN